MERRYSQRLPAGFEAKLSHLGRPVGRFNTRDIGLAGAFIETGPIDLYTNDLVAVSFNVEHGGIKKHTLYAFVVHHSAQGVGLMFVDHYPTSFYVLKALLFEAA